MLLGTKVPLEIQSILFMAGMSFLSFQCGFYPPFSTGGEIYSVQLPVLNQDVQKSSAESKIGHKYSDP